MHKILLFIITITPFITMAQANDSTEIIEGKLTMGQLEQLSWFKQNYTAYKPSMSIIDELIPFKKCSILVVLGTWCSDSHELVPQLIKVLDMAGWKQPELIGVDKKKKCSAIDVTSLNIEYIPVIIVFRQGKEIGRIVETTQKTIEEDLLAIVQKSKQQ